MTIPWKHSTRFGSYFRSTFIRGFQIKHWRQYLNLTCMSHLPAPLSENCIDMIARLCCEQTERIGARDGAKEIKSHSWFAVSSFLIIQILFFIFRELISTTYVNLSQNLFLK